MIWFVLDTPHSDGQRVQKVYGSYLKDLEDGEQVMRGDFKSLIQVINDSRNPVTVLYTTEEDENILLESEQTREAIIQRRLVITAYFDTEDLEIVEGKVRI